MMEKAPKRIWAYAYPGSDNKGQWFTKDLRGVYAGMREYTRTATSNALIAAAYEAAASVARSAMTKYAETTYRSGKVTVFSSGDVSLSSQSAAKCYAAGEILEAIVALTPDDARAAYEAAIRAAKIEGMREAMTPIQTRRDQCAVSHGKTGNPAWMAIITHLDQGIDAITALIEEAEKGQPND
ncbi:hypothetical protein [Pseudooceanicola nitratireducens]|uniref:hypothetical protein n=1 Tax=Pseudooceanicola nitratireducens TaxID=517719 RepID=UPI003C7BA403